MVSVLIGVLVFSLWMGWSWLAADRRNPALPPGQLPGAHPGGPVDLEGTVLFAQRLGRRRIALDCLMRPRRSPGPLAPIHVRASGATLFWGSASLDEVALRWIQDGVEVGADIVGTADHPRVRISHGESFLVLDVLTPAGALSTRHPASNV